MPLALLIPLLAPVFTELVKWFTSSVVPDAVIKDIPPTLLPTVSAAMGGVLTAVAQANGIELGVDVSTGAALGLAGTGVHQTYRMTKQAIDTRAVGVLVILGGTLGFLGGWLWLH